MEYKRERELPLLGMRILVVDDELLIVLSIEDALRDAGAEVTSAATLSIALKSASNETLTAALLDVRLGRETTEAVADVLVTRGIPFVFHTGQALPDAIRAKHPNAMALNKPSNPDVFVDAIFRLTKR